MATPYRTMITTGTRALSPRFHAELDAELEPGERVLWTGVPAPGRLVLRALALVAFPLLWNSFALLLVYGAAKEGGLLCLCAVPFLVVGLPLFQAPIDAFRAIGTTFYAVTDRRAILFDGEEIVLCENDRLARTGLLRAEEVRLLQAVAGYWA
jgi:hypothetical protein